MEPNETKRLARLLVEDDIELRPHVIDPPKVKNVSAAPALTLAIFTLAALAAAIIAAIHS